MAKRDVTTCFQQMLLQFITEPDPLFAMLQWMTDRLMQMESEAKVGAEKGKHSSTRTTYFSGHRVRRFDTRLGTLYLLVPKLRNGGYIPFFVVERKRSEQALIQVVQEAFINGVSTRKIEKLAQALGIETLSASQVSEINKGLNDQVEAFRNRPLEREYPVVWIDALYEKIRVEDRVVNMAVMVVTGINSSGNREILAVEPMYNESEDTYAVLFQKLKQRGLEQVWLVVSDAHAGLQAAISKSFLGASWQRCRMGLLKKYSFSCSPNIESARIGQHAEHGRGNVLGFQNRDQQQLFFIGSLANLIPDDYILKIIQGAVDFSWIRHEVRYLYDPEQGRPSIDPEAALRLMLAGFILGIVNDRTLMREAQVNLAIRWFAGFSLDEPLPDHSSLTRIRQRWGTATFHRCFSRVVSACLEKGLIGRDTIHIDATLVRADVSWDSIVEKHVERVIQVNKYTYKTKEEVRKVITSDTDATLATNSRGQHLEPFYKQHVAVDDQSGVIVDVSLTTGNVNEGDEILAQIDRVEKRLGKRPKQVTADAGYAYGKVYAGFERQGIVAIIPPKRVWANKHTITLHQFRYDSRNDLVKCPRGKILHKTSRCKHGWYYHSKTSDCNRCSEKRRCLSPKVNRRTVVISETYPELLRARRRKTKWTPEERHQYYRHKWRVEGVHAQAKCLHGLRRAARRGIENVSIQSLLTATVINLKRLSKAA